MTLIKLPTGWKRSSAVKLHNDNLAEFLLSAKKGIYVGVEIPELRSGNYYVRNYTLSGLTPGCTYIIFKSWSTDYDASDKKAAKLRIPDTDAEIISYRRRESFPFLAQNLGQWVVIIKAKKDTINIKTAKLHNWDNWSVTEWLQVFGDSFETAVSNSTKLSQSSSAVPASSLEGYINWS